ncbi:hypothetical protein [Sphingomonas profundi]|uniref:hypothetical protein n=1 Tax=Alterirhizorhabdus profundi TaxID=2681549 RepID=UPI0012E82576|nr:hypothetical protein [Sphingomonas profundi]
MPNVQLHGPALDKNGLYVDAGAILAVGDAPEADISIEEATVLVEDLRAVEVDEA